MMVVVAWQRLAEAVVGEEEKEQKQQKKVPLLIINQ
jgi:hypothetical protein